MAKVYYNWLTNGFFLPAALLLHFTPQPFAGNQSPSKPLTTSSLDTHDNLTIAADPWLSAERYKAVFPKKTPYGAGVLAIKVSFRNESNESIRIGLERIRLNLTYEDNNRQELPALTSEQLADAVLHPRLKGSKPRLPLPIPTSPGGRDKNWHEYQKLAEDAGLHASIIAPHGSLEGLLYFDLQNQFDLLQNARLYIPDLYSLERSQALLYFDLDVSRTSAH
jgi:hypothetical protein